MIRRRLLLVLALLLGAPAGGADAFARKPPPKSSTRKKASPPRKKPRPRSPSEAMKQEVDLHHERLALIGRFKEINEDIKDAELAVSIRRLDDLESRRHFLALKVLERMTPPAGDGAEKAP